MVVVVAIEGVPMTCRRVGVWWVFFLDRGELLVPSCHRKGREELLVVIVIGMVLGWVECVGIAVVAFEGTELSHHHSATRLQ